MTAAAAHRLAKKLFDEANERERRLSAPARDPYLGEEADRARERSAWKRAELAEIRNLRDKALNLTAYGFLRAGDVDRALELLETDRLLDIDIFRSVVE